ncbi:Found in mitochondrial proteome protein 29 [Cladobotryum mycophilum]|uniref:Found in mitochondrial proteome protein 29 n=1 Tax=Cladobotryum mycophilum TaxID=491253 RepID=A0ABR0SKG2_9HYPO
MVRRIVFDAGVSWVARVRLPHIESVFGDRELLDVASILKVEVASMKFLKAKTSIPAPEVYSYDAASTNDLGAPYILMDYIHGSVARELRMAKDCDPGMYGTPNQDRKFRQQMANVQAELSSFTFDKIGSLYQNEETSEFFIGPELETGKEPWSSVVNYYADIADHALHSAARSIEHPDLQTGPSFTNPIVFKHLISLYGATGAGPFRLTNRDYGAHNLLVNDNFEIVGVIDFDGIMSAPIEVVVQYPALTGLDREIPGHVATIPAAIERIERTKSKLVDYQKLMGAAESAIQSNQGQTPIADLLMSDAASMYQGLLRYRGHQKWVNDQWMEAYMGFLRRYYGHTGMTKTEHGV